MHPLYWLNQVHSAEVQLAICPPLDGSLLDGVTPVIRSDNHAVEIRFTTTLGERTGDQDFTRVSLLSPVN
jgi:hypothetical protein